MRRAASDHSSSINNDYGEIMFISSTDYKSHIDTLINQSQTIDIAVAFWGKGAFEYLQGTGKQFRIICNLTSGGTNPEVIEALQEEGYEVRHLDDLHAKVVIGINVAVVGSANFSTNGLNIEADEFDGWQEAGYATNKPEDLGQMRDWFDRQWKRGIEITEGMLEQAQANWDARYRTRIAFSSTKKSVLSMTPAELQGRNIYVALYRDAPSDEASKFFGKWKDEQHLDSPTESDTEVGFYEDWDEMERGQKVISVYVGPKGGIVVEGAYEIYGSIQKDRTGWGLGPKMTLQLCYGINRLADRTFQKRECMELAERLRASGRSLSADERYELVPLEQLIAEI
ncbi:phospholipase D family protein [Paraburkholderia fungorum]|uniref:phospholipase D-like domain-containing protein n=1 Tax=Paraburkholderia fungorum TaxID=134537 RepID=UPI0038B71D5F